MRLQQPKDREFRGLPFGPAGDGTRRPSAPERHQWRPSGPFARAMNASLLAASGVGTYVARESGR